MRRLDTDSQRLTKVSASQDFSQRHGRFSLGLGFSLGFFSCFYFFPCIAIGFIRLVLTASVWWDFSGRTEPALRLESGVPKCNYRRNYNHHRDPSTYCMCVPSDLSAGATISPLQMRHRGPERSRTCPDLTDCASGRGGLQTPVCLAQKHVFITTRLHCLCRWLCPAASVLT